MKNVSIFCDRTRPWTTVGVRVERVFKIQSSELRRSETFVLVRMNFRFKENTACRSRGDETLIHLTGIHRACARAAAAVNGEPVAYCCAGRNRRELENNKRRSEDFHWWFPSFSRS